MVAPTWNPNAGETQRQADFWGSPASHNGQSLNSRFSERPCLEKSKLEGDRKAPLVSTRAPRCARIPTFILNSVLIPLHHVTLDGQLCLSNHSHRLNYNSRLRPRAQPYWRGEHVFSWNWAEVCKISIRSTWRCPMREQEAPI